MNNTINKENTNSSVNLPSHRTLADQYEMAKIPKYNNIASDVISILTEKIGTGSMSMTEVSKVMEMSNRTLQRHLHKDRNSFYDIRERLRHHQAINMLMHDGMAIKDIYTSLGFTDRTGFSKAFKRWTGYAPDVFRRLYKDDVETKENSFTKECETVEVEEA